MSFGRTDLSIGATGIAFCALLHRDGPVGLGFQGMREKSFLFLVDLLDRDIT